ncbi:hypothetical protein VTJ49DRAFT_4744 [Mycothermus thermophilus]
MPFRVAVERFPAYSRSEYALEHIESAAPLARLVREGHGAGWVEVDTGVAGRAEAVFLVDVAVAALTVVAHLDQAQAQAQVGGGGDGVVGGHQGTGGVAAAAVVTEVFEPPPVVYGGPNGSVYSGRSSRASRRREEKERKREMRKQQRQRERGNSTKRAMEQFEIDLESQASDLKAVAREKKDQLPGFLRFLVGVVTVTFKCFIWCATVAFKALFAILSGLAKCCGLGKL